MTVSRAAAVALAVALPAVAAALYLVLGNPQALFAEAGAVPAAKRSPQERRVESLSAELKANLERDPGDTASWILLGRSNAALGRYADAASAYAKALERGGDEAQLLADYAQALAMAQGRKFAGKPETLAARALKADGRNIKALAIAAAAASERQDHRGAIAYWRRMLPLVANEHTKLGASVRRSIADAEKRLRAGDLSRIDAISADARAIE